MIRVLIDCDDDDGSDLQCISPITYYRILTVFSVFSFRCKGISDNGIDVQQEPNDYAAVRRLNISGGEDDEW